MEEDEVARMLAVYAETSLSTVAIGSMFNRDHSTVHYHIIKHRIKRGMVVTTKHLHIEQEMPEVQKTIIAKKPEPLVKDYTYYREQEDRRKATASGKPFLCINRKKYKVSSDILDIGVEICL